MHISIYRVCVCIEYIGSQYLSAVFKIWWGKIAFIGAHNFEAKTTKNCEIETKLTEKKTIRVILWKLRATDIL